MPFGIIDTSLKGEALLPGSERLVGDKRQGPGIFVDTTQLKRVTIRVGFGDLSVVAIDDATLG